MTLKSHFEQLETELARQRAENETTSQALIMKEKELEELAKELRSTKKELDKRVRDIEVREKTLDSIQNMDDKQKELMAASTSVRVKEVELARWENKLVEIESRHEREEQEMAERVREQAEREKNYRKELKEAFLEQVRKQLS